MPQRSGHRAAEILRGDAVKDLFTAEAQRRRERLEGKTLESAEGAESAEEILAALYCRCGTNKRAGKPLCWECFSDLLPSTQAKLLATMRMGSMEMYVEACRWLDR